MSRIQQPNNGISTGRTMPQDPFTGGGFWENFLWWKRSSHHGRQRGPRTSGLARTPFVTLFFEKENVKTIAVLSDRIPELDEYFRRCTEEGVATERSPIYFEMDGYVREHLSRLQKMSRDNGCESCYQISIAQGSLKESDEMHRNELTAERETRLAKTTRIRPSPHVLEKALLVACQHRLEQDLDIVSLYCLKLATNTHDSVFANNVNTTLRTPEECIWESLSRRLLNERLMSVQLILTPFVDGFVASGYSTFGRDTPITSTTPDLAPSHRQSLVEVSECGRLVQYNQLPDIPLKACDDAEEVEVSSNYEKCFVPSVSNQGCEQDSSSKTERDFPTSTTFQWCCTELALANLHRWWGDISVSEYVGQKLMLGWNVENDKVVPLAIMRLESRLEVPLGERFWRMSLKGDANVLLNVTRSRVIAIDNVTAKYEGCAKLLEVRVKLDCLVRAVARQQISGLLAYHDRLLESRPLLDSEEAYIELLQHLGADQRKTRTTVDKSW